MESLGLQTVTLSDGTTAYVQQAVKGECCWGPQNPAPQPFAGAHSLLLSSRSTVAVRVRVFYVYLMKRELSNICGKAKQVLAKVSMLSR